MGIPIAACIMCCAEMECGSSPWHHAIGRHSDAYTELNFNLSTSTKKKVYQATVPPVLLYEVETCKTVHLKCLAGFHNHCSPNISDVWSAQYVMWLHQLLYILYNLDPLSLPIACSLLWTSRALAPEGYTACSQHVNCATSITGLYGWNR